MTAPSILQRRNTPAYAGKHAPPTRGGRAGLDWLDATDPGQLRLRMAVEIVLAIGVVLAAEWLFVRLTGALQVPDPAERARGRGGAAVDAEPRAHGDRDDARRDPRA